MLPNLGCSVCGGRSDKMDQAVDVLPVCLISTTSYQYDTLDGLTNRRHANTYAGNGPGRGRAISPSSDFLFILLIYG